MGINKLNDFNFCKVECYYCTYDIMEWCKKKHPEYFEAAMTNVKCPACGCEHKIGRGDWQWHCPNCKNWIAVVLGKK